MSTALRLPSPTPPVWGSTVYVATDTAHERFIGVTATLVEAKVLVEMDNEATPYFNEGVTWTDVPPAEPLPGHKHARRQWIGSVVTEPYGAPHEFRIVEQCIENLPTSMGAAFEDTGRTAEEISAEIKGRR